MKLIQSMLALVGVVQGARYISPPYDCGYEYDINQQIVREFESNYFFTALQYHFSTQELNRPNFVKMLAAKADKKRDNADVLAKFQLSRGYNVNLNRLKFDTDNATNVASIATIGEGLDVMIAQEKEITDWLKRLNKKAEDGLVIGTYQVTPGKEVKDALIDTETCQAPHLADLMSGQTTCPSNWPTFTSWLS